MPTIEFECKQCGHKFKRLVFKGDNDLESYCPSCGGHRVDEQVGPVSLFHDKEPSGDFLKDKN